MIDSKIRMYEQELSKLDGVIEDLEGDIDAIIASIASMMQLDVSNEGLSGVKTGRQLDGNNDDLFLDPYYDNDGNPIFYINQFCPILTDYSSSATKNVHKRLSNNCGASSWTNAFISQFHVHSLVDTLGILSYCLANWNHSTGKAIKTFTGELLVGNKKNQKDSFHYLQKYLMDENNEFKCIHASGRPSDFKEYIDSGSEGTYVFGDSYLYKHSDLDEIIKYAHDNNYSVELSMGGSSAGISSQVFGSSGATGHYVGLKYSEDEGYVILDSYGQRTFKYERDEGINEVGWGGYYFNEGNDNGKRNTKSSGQFIDKGEITHDTTVHLSTTYNSFSELAEKTGISTGKLVFITLTKNK